MADEIRPARIGGGNSNKPISSKADQRVRISSGLVRALGFMRLRKRSLRASDYTKRSIFLLANSNHFAGHSMPVPAQDEETKCLVVQAAVGV